ncbi:MAG: tRNA (adenosine(37)-N6)-threonylcarbamoyltransferase complex ATPase subunit type 1 TsaE [Rhodobacteraceae bacterium]|nr:tRNA (adenosine(37)-N6)-threonylcarbamoyltransferase complex ATPase subunit type 1 TsaE [Paracoccaceae bacterium]
MTEPQTAAPAVTLILAEPEETAALGAWLAPQLRPGDAILLEGPIGAGKSHLARALIQRLMEASGRIEDVPSPTFTLVQVYEFGAFDLWHADLYRLTGSAEAVELGLDEAFDHAVCLVEWPDRLGAQAPTGALRIGLLPDDPSGGRQVRLTSAAPRWAPVLKALANGIPGIA